MKCACPCGEEFEPKRRNQIYLNAEHRRKDSNRRWPVQRRAASPTISRDALGERQEEETSYVTLLLGGEMAQNQIKGGKRAFQPNIKKYGDTKLSLQDAEMLTAAEVAKLLRTSRWNLMLWRKERLGPPFLKIKGRVLYPRDLLMEFLDAKTQIMEGQE